MKNFFAIALIVLMANVTFAAASTDAGREVQIGITGAFIPGGFDSNSEAYVIVSGVFQNGCYKWSRAETASRDLFNHDIISKAIVTPGMCIMVLVPFQKEVRLGKLATGKHSLRFLNGDGTYMEKSLIVE
ncbi:MAG: hypothetical protein AABY53_05725 [Bdellovibrionota bacterium]